MHPRPANANEVRPAMASRNVLHSVAAGNLLSRRGKRFTCVLTQAHGLFHVVPEDVAFGGSNKWNFLVRSIRCFRGARGRRSSGCGQYTKRGKIASQRFSTSEFIFGFQTNSDDAASAEHGFSLVDGFPSIQGLCSQFRDSCLRDASSTDRLLDKRSSLLRRLNQQE